MRNKSENMPSSALARLEGLLQAKKLDGTLLRPWSEVPSRAVPSGIASLDLALGGGWRPGEISELVGPRSTGRTSTMVRALQTAACRGPVALVDVLDRFDPGTAATSGLDLARLLWVRGPVCTIELTHPGRSPLVERAVRQGLRAFDLILRASGFSLVVLDLADVPTRALAGVPSATWLRLARTIEGRDTVGLLTGQAPMGRSARGVTVRLSRTSSAWTGDSLQSRRLAGVAITAAVSLSRADAVHWRMETRESGDRAIG